MSTGKRGTRAQFGSVERLGSGRYRVRYRAPDGLRRSAPETFDTRAQADAYLVMLRADMLRGQWAPPERSEVALADYFTEWLRHRTPHLRPRTVDLYQRLAQRWILPALGTGRYRTHLGPVPLGNITPALIREWFVNLRAATEHSAQARTLAPPASDTHLARLWAQNTGVPVARTGRLPDDVLAAWHCAGAPDVRPTPTPDPNAGRTAAAQAYRLIHSIFAQAARDGLIAANPAQIPKGGHVEHPERLPLTPDEVAHLAQVINPRYRAAVLVAAWSGLRPGEVFALTTTDVDLTAGTLTVRQTLTELPGQAPTLGPPKTAAARRTVALPALVTEALTEHLRTYPPFNVERFIFTTTTGRPVSASARAGALNKARTQIQRPDITWHHLRHTGATLAAQAGATTAEIQYRIGHTSPRAAAIYQHATHHRDTHLAQQLNNLAQGLPALGQSPAERHAQ